MSQFVIRDGDGQIRGPFGADELRRMATMGEVRPDTAVQKVGGAGSWHRAASIRGLVFGGGGGATSGAVPPPLPAQQSAAMPPPWPPSTGQAASAAAPPGGGGTGPSAAGNLDPGALVGRVSRRVSEMTGTELVDRSHVKGLFAAVMARHTPEDAERVFSYGLATSTPSLAEIDTGFPSPWVYTRLLLFLGVAFAGMWFGWLQWANLNLIPGVILIGSFAFPVATAVFFYECNAPRNVSLFAALRMFMWGGVLSLLLALVGFQVAGRWHEWIGASVAGFVEEPGKLAAVILLAGFRPKYRWTLNGMCLGAAVGAGFAAFESAGYAMRIMLAEDIKPMFDNIVLRGVLAPFGHVVWTAVAAGALWRVKGDRPFEGAMLQDRRCLAPLVAVMLIHATWNSSLPGMVPLNGGYFALGAIAWTIAIGLLLGGLKELVAAKASA